jgi:hypothetical protein
MRCIVVSSDVLTIHNNNLASEGENASGGGATESGRTFGNGGTTKGEKMEVVEPSKTKKLPTFPLKIFY